MSSQARRSVRVVLLLTSLSVLMAVPGRAASKSFGSIGLQVVPVATGELVVLKAVDGSPALSAAIKPGDLIVEVDGFALAGSTFSEVVPRYLWGEPGSSVTLKYLRPGVAGIQSVTLQRSKTTQPQQQTPGVKLLTPETANGAK
jgi:carboxyl-terminal processing protease